MDDIEKMKIIKELFESIVDQSNICLEMKAGELQDEMYKSLSKKAKEAQRLLVSMNVNFESLAENYENSKDFIRHTVGEEFEIINCYKCHVEVLRGEVRIFNNSMNTGLCQVCYLSILNKY